MKKQKMTRFTRHEGGGGGMSMNGREEHAPATRQLRIVMRQGQGGWTECTIGLTGGGEEKGRISFLQGGNEHHTDCQPGERALSMIRKTRPDQGERGRRNHGFQIGTKRDPIRGRRCGEKRNIPSQDDEAGCLTITKSGIKNDTCEGESKAWNNYFS